MTPELFPTEVWCGILAAYLIALGCGALLINRAPKQKARSELEFLVPPKKDEKTT